MRLQVQQGVVKGSLLGGNGLDHCEARLVVWTAELQSAVISPWQNQTEVGRHGHVLGGGCRNERAGFRKWSMAVSL